MNVNEILEASWNKRRLENYKEARALVMQAHHLCKPGDYRYLGRIFHIYMQFESDHENYTKALEFCLESLAYYQKTEDFNRIAHSTRHVADLQFKLGQFDAADQNYRKSLNLYRANAATHQGDLANTLRGFAILLEKQGNIEQSIATWKEVKYLYQVCNLLEGVDEADQKLAALQE